MDLKLEGNVPIYQSQSNRCQFLTSKKLEGYSHDPAGTDIHFPASHLDRKKPLKFTSYQKIVLLFLTILQLTSCASNSVIAPFFPEKARTKGVSTTMSGFIYSSYSLVFFLGAPFMGSLNGKFGSKLIILGGISLQGVGNLLIGFSDLIDSTDIFIVLCLISRILEGIGASAFCTCRNTFAAKIFPDDVNFVVGILTAAIGVGFCLGPAIGGVLYNLGGYQLPFHVLGGILLFMIPFNYCLLPGATDVVKIEAWKHKRMWHILKIKVIIIVGLVVIVTGIVWEFIMATISVQITDKFLLSPSQVSIFFFVLTGSYAISGLVWGYVADRTQRIWIIIAAGLFILCVSTLLLGPSEFLNLQSSIVIEYVAIVLWSNSFSMSHSLTFGATVIFSVENGYPRGENLYAFLSSYKTTLFAFGGIVGPVLGSFLVDKFGFPLTCSLISIVCFIMGFMITVYFSLIHKTSEHIPNNNVERETSEIEPLL